MTLKPHADLAPPNLLADLNTVLDWAACEAADPHAPRSRYGQREREQALDAQRHLRFALGGEPLPAPSLDEAPWWWGIGAEDCESFSKVEGDRHDALKAARDGADIGAMVHVCQAAQDAQALNFDVFDSEVVLEQFNDRNEEHQGEEPLEPVATLPAQALPELERDLARAFAAWSARFQAFAPWTFTSQQNSSLHIVTTDSMRTGWWWNEQVRDTNAASGAPNKGDTLTPWGHRGPFQSRDDALRAAALHAPEAMVIRLWSTPPGWDGDQAKAQRHGDRLVKENGTLFSAPLDGQARALIEADALEGSTPAKLGRDLTDALTLDQVQAYVDRGARR